MLYHSYLRVYIITTCKEGLFLCAAELQHVDVCLILHLRITLCAIAINTKCYNYTFNIRIQMRSFSSLYFPFLFISVKV